MINRDSEYSKQTAEEDLEYQGEALSFFDYNEFLVDDYKPIQKPKDQESVSIVITHFPNNHVPISSRDYSTTRVVRIPRIYHTVFLSDIIPQFSLYYPGTEPAALGKDSDFQAVGIYDSNIFGITSRPPEIQTELSESEYKKIITKVNEYLFRAFDPYGVWNCLESFLDLATANLYDRIIHGLFYSSFTARKLNELEKYLMDVNQDLVRRDSSIRFLSPKRTGYISVSTFCERLSESLLTL